MSRAENYYNDQINRAKEEIGKLEGTIATIGWLRLIVILGGLFLSYKSYKGVGMIETYGVLILTFIIFVFIAVIHGRKINRRNKLNLLIEINEKGLDRLSGKYKEDEDTGEELLEEGHPFSSDLDVFGKNSLFQMINTTRTKGGRRKLKDLLSLKKIPTREEIIKRQEAIKELGEKVNWRQNLYINATFKKKKDEELEELISWSKKRGDGDSFRLIIAGIFIAVTLGLIFLAILRVIPFSLLILDLIVNYGVIKILTKDMKDIINLFHSIKYSVRAYSNILSLIQEENFESEYLRKLKNELSDESAISCKDEMRKLASLLDWVGDSTSNAYYFLLNVIVFADIFIVFNLNKWREKNGSQVEKWLSVMGEFDALSSVSNLSFDNEDWCFGEIVDKNEILGQDIGHPLIGSRAVTNNYELKGEKQITLITGSNMSGKSTFLRTVGINLLLTYIGAPACAKKFSCGVMNIYTCMRTKDNLEESISSFYAEILRIKLIIEACKRGEKVFVLLDEIFKGTNSKDRHTGATVLVKQLISNGASGILSTHDLELCDLEESMKEVENYNFREYYSNDKINFDYKLRRGKSTTQNAVYLMKLAGIEI